MGRSWYLYAPKSKNLKTCLPSMLKMEIGWIGQNMGSVNLSTFLLFPSLMDVYQIWPCWLEASGGQHMDIISDVSIHHQTIIMKSSRRHLKTCIYHVVGPSKKRSSPLQLGLLSTCHLKVYLWACYHPPIECYGLVVNEHSTLMCEETTFVAMLMKT